ncbi:hypothetical protein L218DRAFT_576809 [Marasmius fiardii PR-910]|nr:hypothetical protein L218DRAFT_576809 [Marasmius fiardii PR-910]
MFSFGKKLPANWPSLHHKCNNSKCTFPNLPKPTAGTYSCRGCTSSYKVSSSAAAKVDASSRQVFPLYDLDNKPRGHVQVRHIDAYTAQAQAAQASPRAYRANDVQNGALMQTNEEIKTMKSSNLWDKPLSRKPPVKKRGGHGESPTYTRYGTSSASGYGHRRGSPQDGSTCSPPPVHRHTPTASSRQYYSSTREVHSNVAVAAPGPLPKYQYRVRNL